MTTTELVAAWRERHAAEWAERSGPRAHNAEEYALVVAEHRLGGRTTLTFRHWVGERPTPEADREARKLIREQVDAALQEIAPAS